MRHGEKRGALPDRRQGPQHGGWKRREPSQPRRIAVQRAQRRARRHQRCVAETKAPVPEGAGPRRNRRRHRGGLAHGQQSGTEPASRQQPDPGQGRRPRRRGEGGDRSGGRRKRRPGEHLQQRRERGRRQRLVPTARRSPPAAARPAPPGWRRHFGPSRRDCRPDADGGRDQGSGRRAVAVAVATQQAQTRPQRRRIGVRRVLDPCHTGRRPASPRSRAGGHRKQRTQQRAAASSPPAAPCRPGRRRRCRPASGSATSRPGRRAWWPSSRCRISACGAGSFQQRRTAAARARSGKARAAREPVDRQHLRRDAARSQAAPPPPPPRLPTPRADHGRRPARAAIRRAAARPGVGQQRQRHAVGPPETPAASRGAGSNGPSGAIAAANSWP